MIYLDEIVISTTRKNPVPASSFTQRDGSGFWTHTTTAVACTNRLTFKETREK